MARPLRSWAVHAAGDDPAGDPRAADRLRPGPAHRAARARPGRSRTSGCVATKFDPGMLAPLTVVLESDTDFRKSEGLALIDDVSRLLSHQRRLAEVRSATQPLGSPEPLDARPARLAAGRGERRLPPARRRGRAAQQGADRGRGQAPRGHLAGGRRPASSLTGARPAERPIPKSDASVARAGAPRTARRWPPGSSRRRPSCNGARACRRPGTWPACRRPSRP